MLIMKNKIDFFLAWTESEAHRTTAVTLTECEAVNHLYIISSARDEEEWDVAEHVTVLHADNVTGTKFFRQVAARAKAEYAASARKAVPPAALWIMLAGENSRGRSVKLDENKITFLFALTFQ